MEYIYDQGFEEVPTPGAKLLIDNETTGAKEVLEGVVCTECKIVVFWVQSLWVEACRKNKEFKMPCYDCSEGS